MSDERRRETRGRWDGQRGDDGQSVLRRLDDPTADVPNLVGPSDVHPEQRTRVGGARRHARRALRRRGLVVRRGGGAPQDGIGVEGGGFSEDGGADVDVLGQNARRLRPHLQSRKGRRRR